MRRKPYLTTLFATIVLLMGGLTTAMATGPITIDASSDATCQSSFSTMRSLLDPQQRMQLDIAIFKLNMIGVTTASEAPEHPSAVRVKQLIAGLTAEQIIARADEIKDPRFVVAGEGSGVPADLLKPLPKGPIATPIAGTVWNFTSNTNGHIAHDTMTFDENGKVHITRIGAPPRDIPSSDLHNPVAGTVVTRDENGSVRDPRTGLDVGSGTWQQSADAVRISLNDEFAVLAGHASGEGKMSGKGGNKFRAVWTWSAERQ